MQTYLYKPSEADRRVVRKWRLAVVGFYGSLLAIMVGFAIATSSPDVQVARTDAATVPRK